MTDTIQPRALVRWLGGESGHRSFFGGTHSKTRVVLLALFIGSGMVLTPLWGWPGLVIGLIGTVVTLVVTARTYRGSIIDRRRRRKRWATRIKLGTDAFVPYETGAWDQAQQTLTDARGRKAKWEAKRELAAIRSNPDGADGMGWLSAGRRSPGIAWHAPMGEQQYLSVAFAVDGQMRGIESTSVMNRAAEGWGSFMAARAVPSVLVSGVQTLTRVLPADTALQEFWVLNSLDPTVPKEALESYAEVLRITGDGAMVQRHFIIVKWPVTDAFRDAASKYGEGRDGWRALMEREIESARRGLVDARMGAVQPLSARQTAAVMLHQQNPSRPIDYVSDVVPTKFGITSHDEFSAHVVDGMNPVPTPAVPVEWWHRTAMISAESLSTAPRSQLWVLDLLVGMRTPIVRSISFHIDLVPATEAKAAAKRDITRDMADEIAKQEKGVIDLDGSATLTAAKRRGQDLAPGSHHHGAMWVGYVTISAPTRDELASASRELEETCSTGLGVERLDWQDSYQSSASGTTWPIGRGLATGTKSFSAKIYDRLAGKSDKEAIS